jgi:endoglucanase
VQRSVSHGVRERARNVPFAWSCAIFAWALGCGDLSPGPGPWAKAGSGAAGAGTGTGTGTGTAGISRSPGSAGSFEPLPSSAGRPGPMPVDPSATNDDVYGTAIDRAGSFWVARGRIYHGSEEVTLRGINWFGLETGALALFGPVNSNRSVGDMLAQLKSLGFNALRVPLAPESIDAGVPSMAWANRGAIDTGREHFDELLAAASAAGMYMLLDVHTCAAAVGHLKSGPADPRCTSYGVDPWLEDLRTLAELADQYAPFVVGIDLFNEPHGLSHEEWRELVKQAARAVLERNPRILVFVEGVGGKGYGGVYSPFWGENLTGVSGAPFELPASRLVYSPHVYGPSVSDQVYFSQNTFPDNMEAIWDEHFGYLWERDQPVVPGEFGGFYTGLDQTWQDAFVDYLIEKDARSFFYWALNPNSGDTGGLLQDDWRTVNMAKLALLQRLMR